MSKEVIFLDRDGTINIDHGFVHKVDDWEWIDGAVEALKKLQGAGFTLAIVTNQSGIGHDMYTEEHMRRIHDHMQRELKKNGVQIDVIAFCPHRRDGQCECRKPKTGMVKQVEKEIGAIDYENSWTIGDKIADLQFGKSLGTKTALIRGDYWTEGELSDEPDIIADSLREASEKVLSFEL